MVLRISALQLWVIIDSIISTNTIRRKDEISFTMEKILPKAIL